jgi:hypothetical protein
MRHVASWLCVGLLGATAIVAQEVRPDGSPNVASGRAAAAPDGLGAGPVVGVDGTVTLDFEDLAPNQPVAEDRYLELGVRILSSSGSIVAGAANGPCSGRAIQSLPFSGPVKIFRFPAGASSVAMEVGDFGPSDEDDISVVAYDIAGQEIDRHDQVLPRGVPTGCLPFEVAAEGIAEVRVTSSGIFPNSIFVDNLVFRSARGCHQPDDSCAEIIARANVLSANAMSVINARLSGQSVSLPRDLPMFSRNDDLIFFKAVECRTGVSAEVLKAYAYGESLGKMYSDASPHQFLDPCRLAYNLNGWFDTTIWSRYYGARDWPLLALSPPEQFRCYGQISTCGPSPETPPGVQVPNPAPQRGQAACSQPQQPPVNGNGNGNSGNPGNGQNWQRLWPHVLPVMLGDDRPCHDRCDLYATQCCDRSRDPQCRNCSDSFGLGLAQVTFSIGALRQVGGPIEWVSDQDDEHTVADYTPYRPAAAGVDLYPIGATPDSRAPFALRPQQDRLAQIVGDPQYNLLVAAQMAIYKGLFGDGNEPKPNADRWACSVEDPDYGTILVAGPEAPLPEDWEGWFFPVLQLKGGILSNPTQLNQIRSWLSSGGPTPGEQQDSCFCEPPWRPDTCENLQARTFVHQQPDQPDVPVPATCGQ